MDLVLKDECRGKLKKPLGELIRDDSELVRKLKGKKIITVGDKSTQTVLELMIKPKLAIVDYKIERRVIRYEYKGFLNKRCVENPQGMISEKAVEKIKECLDDMNCLLEIKGEEDLLLLPTIIESKEGTIILYGQPNEGIILVKITKDKREEINNLIKICFKK